MTGKITSLIPPIFFIILIILIGLTYLAYSLMNEADKAKFPFEAGKFLMQLMVIIILGGAVQLIYSVLKSQQEEQATESYYSRQLEKGKELLKSGVIKKEEKAVMMLTKLLYDFEYRRQDITNVLCDYLRETYSQEKDFNEERASLLEFSLKSLAQIPRYDENKHLLYIDIHQIRVEKINLYGINFSDFIMWGCQFNEVLLSRGSFQNADLSGIIFNNCGMEFCNFKNAQVDNSFMDNRATTFINTRLYNNNLHESKLYSCLMINNIDVNIELFEPYIQSGRITFQ